MTKVISILVFKIQHPPSSRPSPPGEGESFSVLLPIHRQRCSHDQHTNIRESSAAMSSPGGEETGEGERKTQISFLQPCPHPQSPQIGNDFENSKDAVKRI